MKTLDLEKFIQSLSTDLYSFAYILIPDDLQATQLMIDSVAALMIQKKSLVDQWSKAPADQLLENTEEIKLHLYKSIYDLSKKRYHQLRAGLKSVEDGSGFFSLDFDDKAILFLQERSEFSSERIEFISSKSKTEVLAHLYSARINLIEGMSSRPGLQHEFRTHN